LALGDWFERWFYVKMGKELHIQKGDF